jgi:hypothetical protein
LITFHPCLLLAAAVEVVEGSMQLEDSLLTNSDRILRESPLSGSEGPYLQPGFQMTKVYRWLVISLS